MIDLIWSQWEMLRMLVPIPYQAIVYQTVNTSTGHCFALRHEFMFTTELSISKHNLNLTQV